MSTLTAAAVEKIFMHCLFTDEETKNGTPAELVKVEGIINTFGFHPARLESHRGDVKALLAELPEQFQETGGGGWSFLNACMTKDKEHWGEHMNMDQLFVLGIGLGLAKWQLPREMWKILPGGMPYVVVLNKEKS